MLFLTVAPLSVGDGSWCKQAETLNQAISFCGVDATAVEKEGDALPYNIHMASQSTRTNLAWGEADIIISISYCIISYLYHPAEGKDNGYLLREHGWNHEW